MSWQGYVQNHLVGTSGGRISKAAIVGKQGGVWDAANLTLKPEEEKYITKCFDDVAVTQGSGLKLGDTKYFFVNADTDDKTKKLMFFRKGNDGVVLILIKTACIVVATYNAPHTVSEATIPTEKFADFLAGYV
ncbi:hypothetical protein BOTBODRAFT_186468 [Botryobasidium botryosum FD-172 SS1]|uniref:Profilin n=1 Tax=Botryobasidium botryosum (strain FD-172 SS1) TaxID=930990 RepID=A0A067MM90_BOTB1|nr:hypothetical protein BOTBODRAFT_186468 [Botryobasidium botryosum FD-172 SS1]